MHYRLSNLGQGGQNMILTRDFNAFYETALQAANGIAGVARAKDLSDDERALVEHELGKIRDYTVPMAQAPAPCPACAGCPVCSPAEKPCPAPDGAPPLVLAGAGLVVGLIFGALVL